jgi:ATP-dependent RNA helicase RhlE
VLIATDIAARGIDVDGITHVVNYDLPNVPEQYVHRIGRTARAGAGGRAIAFCDEDERGLLADIEKVIRQRIPVAERIVLGTGPQIVSDAPNRLLPSINRASGADPSTINPPQDLEARAPRARRRRRYRGGRLPTGT